MMSVEEQIYALHTIIHSFENEGLLSDDPASVCIEREGYRSVYPCSRGYPGLDLSQIDWAFENKKFWFNGTIKTLWIDLDTEKAEINADKVEFSKELVINLTENRGFNIIFERYRGPDADRR